MRRPLLLPAFALIAALSGCSSPPAPAERNSVVRVDWLGHNCFSVRSSIGLTVVTDPFNPALVGYSKPANLAADLLLMSGEDPNASYTDLVANSSPMLRGMGGSGRTTISGIQVTGVEIAGNRINTAYSFRLDGVRFCHLGSLERPLTQTEAQRLGPVDVLFLPVGGPKNLSIRELDRTVGLLSPRIVVPMGYQTSRSGPLDLRPASAWLSRQTNVKRLPGSFFTISRATLPLERTVLAPSVP